MHNTRWPIALAAAALLALPAATFAQSTPPTTPPQNPPQQQPSQPPAQTPTEQPAQPPAAGQVDAAAAKARLSQARDTLSQLTSLPEAAKLQGDARTQVSQLISNFNALITTQSEWRSAYAKVDENLTALLGPAAAADQPVGTSGSASLDPAIRAKLVEFRTQLKAFESAAGGASGGEMPPAAPTPATSNPANPANPPSAAPPATPPAASVSPASPTAAMDPADRAKAAAEVNATGNAEAQKELDAISAILGESKTGTLTKAQTAALKKHVDALRALLAR
jgi:hypothetical protein